MKKSLSRAGGWVALLCGALILLAVLVDFFGTVRCQHRYSKPNYQVMRHACARWPMGVCRMKLNEVKLGYGTPYWCKTTQTNVTIVAVHHDDGACLIAEKHVDGDIGGPLVYTEASYLEEAHPE